MSDDGRRDEALDELLGAFALDAVDDLERRRIEAYLDASPPARAEVEAHREVAALLASGVEAPPDGLWDRIAGSLEDTPPAPGPRLAEVLPPQRRRRRGTIVATVAAAVVAVLAAVAVTVAVVGDDEPTLADGAAIARAYDDARSSPGSRRATLAGDDQPFTADAVVLADGTGFLAAEALPALPETETWQLWGVYGDDDVISLGVLGNRPGLQMFSAHDGVLTLVVTREAAGGVVSSTSGAVLAGQLA